VFLPVLMDIAAGAGPGSCADVAAVVGAGCCCCCCCCCGGGGDGENSREQTGTVGGTGGKLGSSAMVAAVVSSAAATSSSVDVSASASCLGCTMTTTLVGAEWPVTTAIADFFLMIVSRYSATVLAATALAACI